VRATNAAGSSRPSALTILLEIDDEFETAVRFSQTEIFEAGPTNNWYHRCRT
jgi:hypothetical protein